MIEKKVKVEIGVLTHSLQVESEMEIGPLATFEEWSVHPDVATRLAFFWHTTVVELVRRRCHHRAFLSDSLLVTNQNSPRDCHQEEDRAGNQGNCTPDEEADGDTDLAATNYVCRARLVYDFPAEDKKGNTAVDHHEDDYDVEKEAVD